MTETISEDYLSQLKNAIIDLYLDVKIRSTDEVLRFIWRLIMRQLITVSADRRVLRRQVRKRTRALGRRGQLHHN